MARTGSAPIGPGEAAQKLGVSVRTVQRWLREGRLPSVQVGGRLKVDPSAFSAAAPGQAAASAMAAAPAVAPARSDPTQLRPIRRLLVANRGELVARISRTARAMGIATVALAPEDQWSAWWVRTADARVRLAGTYLDADAVLDAARRAGADAIHPGYGFLAERADFADAVAAAGFAWVGPPAAAMRALGDKGAARRVAGRLGVPVLRGYDGPDQHDDALEQEATAIGYPLLVKPSAGGGGKGMHVVRDPGALRETLAQARREARASFGDERLVLERLIEGARHVEVQMLLDAHGHGVHLGERDCSLQRRYQKLIEESPSPAVGRGLRARLGEAALAIAGAAGYVGAGTAEFLLDAGGAFFFLEVNARLQVEHPVTEAVTGRDLVADQLRIAAGGELGFTQADVTWRGSAIEARLYAEDPWDGFVPATGTVLDTRWPAGDGVRVDAGIGADDVIGARYDSLLAKIIVHARTREAAIAGLDRALERTSILGVTTNRGFLRTILAAPELRAGRATTDLVDRTWHPAEPPARGPALATAAAVLATGRTGFRLNAPARLRLAADREERTVEVDWRVGGALPWVSAGGLVALDVDGLAVRVGLAAAPTTDAAVARAHVATAGISRVEAPMPGWVRSIRVTVGEAVVAGQLLVTLEAMKMEHSVTAPTAGTVTRVLATPDLQVRRGDTLVELE